MRREDAIRRPCVVDVGGVVDAFSVKFDPPDRLDSKLTVHSAVISFPMMVIVKGTEVAPHLTDSLPIALRSAGIVFLVGSLPSTSGVIFRVGFLIAIASLTDSAAGFGSLLE
jgi:hypothetical protein